MNQQVYFRQSILNNLRRTIDDVRKQAQVSAADKAQALHILEFALALPDAWIDLYQLIQLLSPAMVRNGQRRRWMQILHKALPLAALQDDPAALAYLHRTLGMLLRQVSDFTAAGEHLQQSYDTAIAIGDYPCAASAATELAYAAQIQHKLVDAKVLIAKAHRLLAPDDPARAPGYSVLGDIYYNEQRWADAATTILQAIALWEMTPNPAVAASGWRGLARVRWATGEYEAALHCYERAMALYQELGDPLQIALTAIGLGTCHLNAVQLENSGFLQKLPKDEVAELSTAGEKLQTALHLFALAEERLLHIGDHFHLAMLNLNYGIAHRLTGSLQLALQALERSFAYYQELMDWSRQVNVLTEIALVHIVAAALDEADHTLLRADQLLTQVHDEKAAESLAMAINQGRQQLDTAQAAVRMETQSCFYISLGLSPLLHNR